MSWTPDRVELLKKLWGSGKTASQIAEIIGGVSRNAVIGKSHRLNLSAKIKTRSAVTTGKSLVTQESFQKACKEYAQSQISDQLEDFKSD